MVHVLYTQHKPPLGGLFQSFDQFVHLPWPLVLVVIALVISEFSGHIACRCATVSMIAVRLTPGLFWPSLVHSRRVAISASIICVCIRSYTREFAREYPSTVDMCLCAAPRLHHSSPCGSCMDTRVYPCIRTRTAWQNDSAESKKSLFFLFDVICESRKKERGSPDFSWFDTEVSAFRKVSYST